MSNFSFIPFDLFESKLNGNIHDVYNKDQINLQGIN